VLPLLLLALLVLLAVRLLVVLLKRFRLWRCARWAQWVLPRSLLGRLVLLLVQRLALPVERTRCSLRLSFRRLVVPVVARLLPRTLSSLAVLRLVWACSRLLLVVPLAVTLVVAVCARMVSACCLG
jgi:hypothetical protein